MATPAGAAVACPPASLVGQARGGAEPTLTVLVSVAISYFAYRAVYSLVPALANDLVAKGLRGRDMLKPGFKRDDDDDGPAAADDSIPGRKHLSVSPSQSSQATKRLLS